MRCMRCGAMNNENDQFCRTCGAKIVKNTGMPQMQNMPYNARSQQMHNTSMQKAVNEGFGNCEVDLI